MSKRCKHENVEIVEYGTSTTTHWRYAGYWYHLNATGDYTGVIEVNCPQCNLHRLYGSKNRPKWLRTMMEEWDTL